MNRTYRATIRFKPISSTPTEAAEWGYTNTDSDAFPRWSEDPSWRIVDADWTSWVVLNVAWPANDAFMAPGAIVDDGALYAHVLRRKASIWRKLWIFTKIEDGTSHHDEHVELFKLTEFVVHPQSSRGHMVLSGEAIPVQSIHGKVQHRAASFVY